MKINQQYFSREQVEKKEHYKLLDVLMSENYGVGKHYNDIRIYLEDDAAIIEWIQVNPEYSDARFEAIDDDQRIMTEFMLPDQTFVFFETKEEFDEYLKEWLETNPGWERTRYGNWTNVIENEKFLKDLYREKDPGISKEEYEEIFKTPTEEEVREEIMKTVPEDLKGVK